MRTFASKITTLGGILRGQSSKSTKKTKRLSRIGSRRSDFPRPQCDHFTFIKVDKKKHVYMGSKEAQEGPIPYPVRTKFTVTNAGQKVKGGFKNDGVSLAVS